MPHHFSSQPGWPIKFNEVNNFLNKIYVNNSLLTIFERKRINTDFIYGQPGNNYREEKGNDRS